MLDGEETVQIAWGELRWEGARQHAGRTGNRANSLGELRWEEARQHAGRRGNSLRKALLGGSESMLDGQETVEIAWGELRWEGARQHAGSERACWTDRKTWK